MAWLVFGIASISSGCKDKSSATDVAAETAQDCDRMAGLGTTPWSALQKDRCLAELGSVGPNLRVCFHACLQKAKSADDLTHTTRFERSVTSPAFEPVPSP